MAPGEFDVAGDKRFATITLRGDDPDSSKATFNSQINSGKRNGFSFDYRVKAINASNDPANTQNDLLAIRNVDAVLLQGGVINIMTDSASATTGYYLIIDSDKSINKADGSAFDGSPDHKIDGINYRTPGDVGAVWGTINGKDIVAGGPRGDFAFELRSKTATGSQLWLTVDHNTLQTTWQGGNGVWSTGDWKSTQFTTPSGTNIYDRNFYDGDLTYFNDAAGVGDYTVTVDRNVIVSGVDVTTTANITLDGAGGIEAKLTDGTLIVGDYANQAIPLGFATTGMLVKNGPGTLTLGTATANKWQQGTLINGGTIKLSGTDALGIFDPASSTPDNGRVTFDAGGTAVVSTKEQTVRNQFIVTSGFTNVRIGTESQNGENASHTTITAGAGVSAAIVNANAGLILDAAGGDLIFRGNAAAVELAANARLDFKGDQNIYLKDNILDSAAAGRKTVTREQGGFTQIEKDSTVYADTTVRADGTFRVVKGATYGGYGAGGTSFALNGAGMTTSGTLAGGGTLQADGFIINGNIDPDAAILSTGNTALTAANKYSTLTLQGDGASSAATLNGFTFRYDAKEANTATTAANTPNDLFSLKDMDTVNLVSGTVTIQPAKTHLPTGKYLVIDADGTTIVGNNSPFSPVWNTANTELNALLAGAVNGKDFKELSARTWYQFRFNDTNVSNEADERYSQIWLDAELSSLTMDWTPVDGLTLWDTASSNFISQQVSELPYEVAENVFRDGDKVHISTAGNAEVVVKNEVHNPLVSGLVIGRSSAGANANGNITISGTGGVTSRLPKTDGTETDIIGRYLAAGGQTPTLTPTGMLQKYGSGTLTFANTGGNMFAEGAELHGGITAISRSDQLGVGAGKAVTFKADSTLRSNAVVAMGQTVNIDSGVTATFDAGAKRALLLDGKLAENAGTASVIKTGAGILQIKNDTAISGTTTVRGGTFRVAGDRDAARAVYGNNAAGVPSPWKTGRRLPGAAQSGPKTLSSRESWLLIQQR